MVSLHLLSWHQNHRNIHAGIVLSDLMYCQRSLTVTLMITAWFQSTLHKIIIVREWIIMISKFVNFYRPELPLIPTWTLHTLTLLTAHQYSSLWRWKKANFSHYFLNVFFEMSRPAATHTSMAPDGACLPVWPSTASTPYLYSNTFTQHSEKVRVWPSSRPCASSLAVPHTPAV